MFKVFFRKIKNVLRWLPTIWKDEDWDNIYINNIFIKKLEHTRDFFSSKSYHLNAEDIVKEIQETIDKLNKTNNDWDGYEETVYDKLANKWGESELEFGKANECGSVPIKITYKNIKTSEDQEAYHKERKEELKKIHKKYKKDKKEAYIFLAEHIDNWWD